jgi:AraC family transcriptional regulator
MIAIRESLQRLEDLPWSSSSRGKWDGIVVQTLNIKAGSEIALAPQPYHLIPMVIGGLTDCVQRRGSQSYRSMVRPGTIMIVPAGVASYFNCSKDHRTSTTQIPTELLEDAAQELGLQRIASPELLSVFESRDTTIASLITICLDELPRPSHPAQALIVGSCSYALAAHLVRTFDSRKPIVSKQPTSLDRHKLEAVLEYIESNMSISIGLAEVAAVANVSRFHFSRLFKASTGLSPMAYVERSRIDRSKALLRAGSLRLAEVAAATGFADQSHFIRRFHLHTGITPGQYERESRAHRPTRSSSSVLHDIAPVPAARVSSGQ